MNSLRTGARCIIILLGALVFMVSGCGMLPKKPEVVFVSYRDEMRKGAVEEARQMLTDQSRRMAIEMSRTYHLEHPPENLAFLNLLDPVASPVAVKISDKGEATLRVRTLKGGIQLVRMVKQGDDPEWKVDLTKELNDLRSFLEVRQALNLIREQAGEFAATLKAFNDQIERFPEKDRQ